MSNMMRRSTYSFSAPAVWQIQLLSVTTGDVISWGAPVRFRHVMTSRYLSVEAGAGGKLAVTTASSRTDSSTVFSINSVLEGSRHVQKGSFLHLRRDDPGTAWSPLPSR